MQAVGALQDAVQRELAWRKREISAVRAMTVQAGDAAHHVFRGGQVLLCAHWEGFLKGAARLYLEHVFSQDVRLRELSPTFIAAAYFGPVMKAASAKYPGSEEHHVRLASQICSTFDAPVDAPSWKVDTEGNPGTEVVERILTSVGLHPTLRMDAAGWATTRVFINEHLVRDRNHVAHGEGLQVSKAALVERVERLLDLLDRLANEVVRSAERREYLRAPLQ